jgi:exoribonuclease-2
MPGHKITMLPDAVVQHYTLQEGRACPALSLYVQFDAATLVITHSHTRLEQVPIAANLRHDQLDDVVTPQWLDDPSFSHPSHVAEPAMPRAQLAFLHRLARHLKAQREVVRGKPETFNRPDYNFRLQGLNGGPPCGQETVDISVRQRGAALDLIVAEAMILANSTWGQWMASLGVPAIYRSQASLAPGIKVRMGTKALPHAGIGVPCYAWSTSPLRRYTDLVNQWQLIACVRHGATAALAAPFKPKDAALFSIISAFEETYSAYNAHQASMERFWTLQWLRQHQTQEIDADVIKAMPGMPVLARAQRLPLVLPIVGGPATLARGQQVRLRLGSIDDISLDVPGQFVSLMEGNPGPEPATEGDEEESTGTIAIAVDLNEADGDTPAPTHN